MKSCPCVKGKITTRELKFFLKHRCLVGLMVKASASRANDLRFSSRLRLGFSHTSDLKNGTQVGTPPGAWHYRVNAGTGWSGVSIL